MAGAASGSTSNRWTSDGRLVSPLPLLAVTRQYQSPVVNGSGTTNEVPLGLVGLGAEHVDVAVHLDGVRRGALDAAPLQERWVLWLLQVCSIGW